MLSVVIIFMILIALTGYYYTRDKMFFAFLVVALLMSAPIIINYMTDETPSTEKARYKIEWMGIPDYYVDDYEIREAGIYFDDYWTSNDYRDSDKLLTGSNYTIIDRQEE